jgi:hypothetical protein
VDNAVAVLSLKIILCAETIERRRNDKEERGVRVGRGEGLKGGVGAQGRKTGAR